MGDGELRSEIEKKVYDMGIDKKVLFLGLREDVQAIYNAMDMFVLPSWYEGLPVVSVEAQANGLRCVFSTNVTSESKLTGSAEFMDLAAGASNWAIHILQGNNSRNSSAEKEMRLAGFDIETQAQKLVYWYKVNN